MSNGLDAAISGLNVAQQSLNVIATNISNASTVGYTRKILPQSSSIVNGTSIGVASEAITRNVSESLLLAVRRQNSTAGYYSVVSDYMEQIMRFNGSSDANSVISLKLGNLEDAFINLSASPNSNEELEAVLGSAEELAIEFNNYSNLLNDMRSQTESDITSAIDDVNQALEVIASLNGQITELAGAGRSVADLEDLRDEAVKTVTEYMDVNTYYEGSKLVVITKAGTTLADTKAHPISFTSSNMTPTKYYPGGSLNGLIIDGIDVTSQISEGKIGALFELRDKILPEYQAQLDELAQKIASRFASDGLTLFTDGNGTVPANGSNYTGIASSIQVNRLIMNDTSLLRNGTTGNIEEKGSIEVIARVIEYVFGEYAYQRAEGNVDISAGDLNTTLALTTNNRVTGNVNIAVMTDFSTLTNVADITPGADFDITCGAVTKTITVQFNDTAQDLVTQINGAFGSTIATINTDGAIAFNYKGNITLAANALGPSTNAMDVATLAELGLTYGTTTMPNSSFSVQVGLKDPVTISVLPGDDATDLLAKLNSISGVNASLNGDGELVVTPSDGGDIKLTDLVGNAVEKMGISVSNIAHTPFAQTGLGASGTLSTGLLSSGSIINFTNSMISDQSEDASTASSRAEQEANYLETLDVKSSDISGVNLDKEMSDLIRIQAAYSAAAKMISQIKDMFDELIAAMT